MVNGLLHQLQVLHKDLLRDVHRGSFAEKLIVKCRRLDLRDSVQYLCPAGLTVHETVEIVLFFDLGQLKEVSLLKELYYHLYQVVVIRILRKRLHKVW